MYFRIGRRLPVAKWKTRALLRRCGLLDRAATVPFHDTVAVLPMDEGEGWQFANLGCSGTGRRAANLAKLINERAPVCDVIDCGANWGAFSLSIAERCPGVASLLAIEPNPKYHEALRTNLAGYGFDARVLGVAVGEATGRGRLETPATDRSPHACYVVPDARGSFDIARLDDLCPARGNNVVLKLDVEGEELPALRSAAALLRAAPAFVLCVEFHRAVMERRGITARDIFDYVDTIRPTAWFDAEAMSLRIDPARSVFEQTGNEMQCDLFGVPA